MQHSEISSDKTLSTAQLDVEPLITQEGELTRIVYESEETGFFVGRLHVESQMEEVTIVGNVMAVSVGETLRVKGRWVQDKRFGRQLRVEEVETLVPSTVQGIERYLGSGLIAGIGRKYAKRLVDAFGLETLRVIDEKPQRLREVPGIGRKRAERIREAWASQKAIQSIMIFLQGHGVTTSQAVKIYKRYGDGAVAVMREDPYRLAEDIAGIAFRGADKIAAELGIEKDSPQRLKAGLLHALRQALQAGHVYLPQSELQTAAAELLAVTETVLTGPLEELCATGGLVRENDALYLPGMHAAEQGCAKLMQRLVSTPLEPIFIHMENALRWVERTKKLTLSEEQRDAVRKGVSEKVVVITGGPGTGKTTVLNSLLAILARKGISFVLAAPTGRAAKRMSAATDREASTLHRLLEFSPQTGAFVRNESNPLNTDMLVVDEASMVDAQLMHSMLSALPPFARLILVGDVDQLPSVGAGNVLFDIIASGVVPVVRLNTIFRQAAQSGIVTNAHQINVGKFPEFNKTDFFLIERNEPDKALETIVELVTRRVPPKFGVDPIRDIQVLAPVRRGPAGVNRLNEALQAALNPQGTAIPRRSFRCGDKVMQLHNNYELDVFNGDVGVITLFDEETGELEVTFEDQRVVLYQPDETDALGLAYASTVHKSQGSEYPIVILAFLSQYYMMLQRNLLYTAITRGKKIVIIVGESKAVGMALHRSQVTHRNTHLTDRLKNIL